MNASSVEAALAGLPVQFVHNPDYADGLGTSLKAGIAAVPEKADGAIVCLGDMPQVDSALIDRVDRRVRSGTRRAGGGAEHRRPPRQSGGVGAAILQRTDGDQGDIGARHLIGSYAEAVVEVPLTGDAALTDVDTPESLSAVKAEIERA